MFGLSRVVKRIENEKSLDSISKPVAEWVSKVTSPDKIKYALSGSWLGHQLHPPLTDVPIGAWAMASVLDLTGGEQMRPASQRLVALGILSSIPVAITGASDWSDSYGKARRVGTAHALANSMGMEFQIMSWLARRKDRHVLGASLSLIGLGFTGAAGYLGGHLSFDMGVGVNHAAFEKRTNKWTDVAAEEEIQEGQLHRVTVNDTPVVITRHKGDLHAMSATCAHAGGPLDKGEIEGDCIVCPWHQSKFRITDGTPQRGPAGANQPMWQVRAEDGRIAIRSAE
ncbi:hypothetical protein GCM10023190_24020 [Enteractinococcus fodinae]|uniref:Nitrite reductase/ring-hydroxylating ferredoxin subunit/uncharacterized membrane protein n=1 Tax=Enteractinococcus fodinae TaxID=684663 RepID=A0ABU2B2K9_9MICC|nr:Rieske 2Fe-2S domain-containing protein [Enteractinococcus fodinae]MDR7347833.1 nitrite reductase/ring-hydroxylating ferredoxin subunit/uncharacterized membrane protein [Enteractinococcus fodinae]